MTEIIAHYHSAIEIIFMQEGTGSFYINNQSYNLNENDILIVNSNNIHSGKAEKNSIYQCILFNLNIFEIMHEDNFYKQYIPALTDSSLEFVPYIDANVNDYQSIRHIVKLIIEKNNVNNTFYVRGCLMQLLNELANLSLIIKANSVSYHKNINSLKKVIDYMQKNYQHKISIKELAKISNFSQQYFCEYFKKNINETPVDFLNMIRIRAATQLLLKTDMRIIDISYETGFNNFSYFSKVFQKITGLSPSKYRSNFNFSKTVNTSL